MAKLDKILVPTDFSEHSTKAVRYGADLAATFGAELHLFHAVEIVATAYVEGPYLSPDNEAEVVATATRQLEQVSIESATDLKVVRKVVQGHPFVEIVRYAKENAIDMIVIGTHGRGAIAHMLLGSVAERVVRKAPCPVMVVRDAAHGFVMP